MKVIKILCIFMAILSYSNSFAQSQQDLWDKLRNGGLVVLMGHAKTPTDSESNTSLIERDISCKKERPLSAQGRNQAILIGEKFIKNKVPIERLLTALIVAQQTQPNLLLKSATP